MTNTRSLPSVLLRGLDWRAALRAPRTWAIFARHMVPVAGVLMLQWSGIQAISLVALDTLAGLWCLVAVASVLAAREEGVHIVDKVASGTLVFVFVAGLMTLVVAVVAFVLGGSVLSRAELDPHELLEGGWVWWAFGGLLVLQVPHFLALSSSINETTAKSVLEPRVGYLLRRLILAGIACSFLTFLWGKVALVGALLVTQVVLAAHEVFGERLHATLFPELAPAAVPPIASAHRKRGKRSRRR